MRRRAPAKIGIRDELAARCRWHADEWRSAMPEDEPTARRFDRTAAALDAGEPVELSAWELPPDLPHDFAPSDRVRLDPDGSLSPAPPLSEASPDER